MQFNYSSILGYYSPADIESVEESTFRHFLIFHNVMNAAATFVSPLAGLIRTIVALVTLHLYNQSYPDSTDPIIASRKNFLIGQAIRGGGEFLAFGTLLGLIDLIVTLNRYQLCCFAEAD